MLTDYTSRVMNRAGVWGYWKLDEASGSTTLADSSGQSHPLTLAGSPAFSTTGPAPDAKSIDFSTGVQYGGGATPPGGNNQTFECWVYLAALPTAQAGLMGTAASPSPGGQNSEGSFWINTNGTVTMYQYNGNFAYATTTTPLALATWHHLVGSFSTTTMKVRINKVTQISVSTGSAAYGARPFWLHGGLSNGGGAVRIAAPSYYLSALADTETDAGYDAMNLVAVPVTYLDLDLANGKTLVAPIGSTAPAGFRRVAVNPTAPTPTAVGQLWLDNDE